MKKNDLYSVILSENFGAIEYITNFNKSLSSLSYPDRIIETLIHRKKISKDIAVYREAEKLILKHVNSKSFSLIEKPKQDINDPITNYTYEEILDVFYTKCSNVLIHYDLEINNILGNSILFLYNKYSLVKKEIIIDLNNEKLSLILPLLISFKKWKKIIKKTILNEVSLIKRFLRRNEILGLLVELNEKVEGEMVKLFNLITNLDEFKEYPKDEIFETRLTSDFNNINDYDKVQVNKYISFVKNLSIKDYPKFKIIKKYKQSELLKILDNFKNECSFVEFNTYDFVYYYTTSDKKRNLDLAEKNDRINNSSIFSKEHRGEILSLIYYLNNNGILEKISKRSLALVIQEFYSTIDKNRETTIYNQYIKDSLPTHSIEYLNRLIDRL